MLTRLPLLALALGTALASVACVTTVSDDGAGGAGNNGQGGDGAGTTSSQGGSTSDGGAGQGGSAQGGSGQGGAGGGAECVGHTGTGVMPATCDDDVSGGLSTCPSDSSTPPPRLICDRSFELFSEGARENLISCLLDIGAIPADNCGTAGEDAVEACVTAMYDEACATEDTDIVGETGICAELAAACTEANLGTFDTANCLADLNVFSDDGVNEYIGCANENTELDCAELHDTCFGEVFTY